LYIKQLFLQLLNNEVNIVNVYRIPDKDFFMRYHDLPGEGTAILFIHGLGCAGSFDYPEVAAQASLANRRRILVDLIGSGFSDKPEKFDYSVRSHALYLKQFLESLGLQRVILYGHSLGGAIALTLAALIEATVERVILCEANLDRGGGLFSKSIAECTFSDFIETGFQEAAANLQKNGNEMWRSSFALTAPGAIHGEAVSLVNGDTPSWREILYSLKCPTGFIAGTKSFPEPFIEELEKSNIPVITIKDVGHFMAWEAPDQLAMAIAAFCNQGDFFKNI